MRFRCLTRQRHLMYLPPKCASIITACAILHNMCRDANDSKDLPNPDDDCISDLDESDSENENDEVQHPAISIPPPHVQHILNATAFQRGRHNQRRVSRAMEAL